MDVLKGFFSARGSTSRLRLLAFLAAALLPAWIAILLMRDGTVLVVTLAGALLGLTTAKLVIEAARRRQDMGKRAAPALVLLALAAVAAFALAFYGIAAGPRLLSYVALLLFFGVAAFLLLGTPKVDLASQQASSQGGRAGPIVAILLTALGASLAYAGYRWTEGAAQQRAQDQAVAEQRELHAPEDSGVDNLEAIYAKEHAQ
ncbi:hypothetical protein [Allosphingosinicella deserti]|uniref:Uncharacterized protein n=1 Tax=Allosphingosinicella deserti TaxID=2116704 RepID=A0A2P7QYS4_9SPHN|nr:hypothetical protein [Sphingomonas deserti]PSJ43122.1 hypothetical protein C7I55_01675 [Sphingomonas deserti]